MSSSQATHADGPVISESLLALLVCPIDKGQLELVESRLVCSVCGRAYPIENGIPNMLIDGDE